MGMNAWQPTGILIPVPDFTDCAKALEMNFDESAIAAGFKPGLVKCEEFAGKVSLTAEWREGTRWKRQMIRCSPQLVSAGLKALADFCRAAGMPVFAEGGDPVRHG